MNSETQILNLLYKYCWCIDQGMFDEMAEMFSECDIYYGDYLAISHDKEAFKQGFVEGDILYAPDQTTRTIHMCIDPIIHVDEEAGTATAQHYTVVLQGITGVFQPQIIVMDIKYDTFKRNENGEWRFATRKMGNRAAGDLSHHQHNPDTTTPYWSIENTKYFPECRNM